MPSKVATPGLPIIDFAPFLDGSPEGKLAVGKSMVQVMKEYGFMYIINHGISSLDQEKMFEWSQAFFSLTTSQKMKCPHPTEGANHRGFSSMGKEKASQAVFLSGEAKHDAEKLPDIKESFDTGNEIHSAYQNIWPEEKDIPGFKEYCIYYWSTCNDTSKKFLQAIALGMGLEETFFIPYHDTSDNQLRLLHYPPTDETRLKNGKSERIGAHTDFGTLTMLLQDECGGLQVEDPHTPGLFIDAPCIPGSLVVNTGDFLQRWSNDTLKSTLHRVTAPPVDSSTGTTRVRYSIPFFVCANWDRVIEALEGTYSDTNPKKYDSITAGEYLTKRLNATY